METVIYVDILFIVNFSMDFLSLYICAKLLSYGVSLPALLLSSGIGGIYAVAQVFTGGSVALDITVNILITMLLCFITFGFSSFVILLRNTIVLYGIGFALGGAMTALYYALNQIIRKKLPNADGDNLFILKGVSLKSLLPILLFCILLIYFFGRIIAKTKNKKRVKVGIEFCENKAEIEGLVDTGNLLCEPLSGLPCIVCTYSKIESLLPEGLKKMFLNTELGIMEYVGCDMAKKLRIIPLSGVGGSGIILGFIPDKCYIENEQKNFCIACEGKSKDYGGCDCIVPSSLV